MNPIENVETCCPWCNKPITLAVECLDMEQEYIEDCPICCAPMLVRVLIPLHGDPQIEVERDSG